MGDMSPVLASFLAGQQTAAGTIDKAKDAALRKQQLDQMIKQFDAEMKMRDAEYKLHQQQVDLTRKQHVEKLKQDLSKQWAENPATAPGSKQFTMSIPGLEDLPSNILPPVPGSMVEAPSEYGPLQVMMPKSENQLALEKATATQQGLLPGIIKAKEAEATIDRETNRQQSLLRINEQNNKLKQDYERAVEIANLRGQYGLDNTALKNELNQMKMQLSFRDHIMSGGYTAFTPEEMKGQAVARMRAIGLGNEKVGNTQIDKDAKAIADKLGWNLNLPADFAGKVYESASNATSFLNNFDNMLSSIKAHIPTSITGKLTNRLADKFGIEGMSPYKSVMDMFSLNELPRLDIALGLTPGTLSRAPRLYERLRTMAGLPGDDAKTLNVKKFNGVDMFLSAASRSLSKLPASQRAEYWNKIIDDNQDLFLSNKAIHDKLLEASKTGNYAPNSTLKQWLTDTGIKY